MNIVGQPVRVFTDQACGIVAIRLAHAPGVGPPQPNVPEPGVNIGDGGHFGKRRANGARPVGGDAFDGAQGLRRLPQHFEHPIAKARDCLRRARRAEVLRIRHEEGHHAAPVEVIDQLKCIDADLPAVLGMTDPRPGQAHDGPQGDVRRQVAQRADPRAIGLLERKDGEPALVAEMDGHQSPNHVRRRPHLERWQRQSQRHLRGRRHVVTRP